MLRGVRWGRWELGRRVLESRIVLSTGADFSFWWRGILEQIFSPFDELARGVEDWMMERMILISAVFGL